MKMMENEDMLMESNDKQITLTSHRIRQERKQWGKLQIKSIMLEHVSSCEYDKKSHPLFLILGIVVIAFGVLAGSTGLDEEVFGLAILVGIALLIAYWLTIRKGLIVSSSSGKMIMNTKGMKDDNIQAFINKLEGAKNQRYYNINKVQSGIPVAEVA